MPAGPPARGNAQRALTPHARPGPRGGPAPPRPSPITAPQTPGRPGAAGRARFPGSLDLLPMLCSGRAPMLMPGTIAGGGDEVISEFEESSKQVLRASSCPQQSKERHMPDSPAAVRLDPTNACLWRGTEARRLTPQAWAVLAVLVAQAGQLVTKETLLQTAWPETVVSEAALVVCIREIRQALGDTARTPQYVETVHRWGYRFIGPLAPPEAVAAPLWPATTGPAGAPPTALGREAELHQVHGWLTQAQGGTRCVGFVTGEAGIGKTTLVDAFVAQAAATSTLWLARGQCIEHYGAGEAYLPVLEALGQLCRGPEAAPVLALLEQHAPLWLLQLPAVLRPPAREALQRQVQGATPERMLRECAEAVEALTAVRPLVLVLEDLHWSDQATLALVAYLAQRRAPARLLLLGTYRPVDVIVHGHPLKAVKTALTLHGDCVDVALAVLPAPAVAAVVAARLPGPALPPAVVEALHRRTDGHPLFLVQLVEALRRQGVLVAEAGRWVLPDGLEALEAVVPESLRALIEQQFDGLSPAQQQVLAAASVAGLGWPVAAVAAGVEADAEQVEAWCAELARQGQFVQAGGLVAWPDGTVGGSYQFRHALYQQVVYDRLPVGQRVRLHQRLGLRVEAGYGERVQEVAAELARHFAQGRDYARVVAYLRQAGERALMRSACREAMAYFEQALRALAQLPETRETREHAIDLWLALRSALQPLGDLERVLMCLRTAETLAAALDDPRRLARISLLLSRYFSLMGMYNQASTAAQRALTFTAASGDTVLQALAHLNLGLAYQPQGDYRRALACYGQTVVVLDEARCHEFFGQTMLPAVNSRAHLAWCHAELGTFAEGSAFGNEGLQIAEAVEHPGSLMVAFWGLGLLVLRQGDLHRALPPLERAMRLCHEADLPMWFPTIAVELGAAYTLGGRVADAVSLLTRALEQAMKASGSRANDSVSLGEAHLWAGHLEDAHTLAESTLGFACEHQECGRQAYALRLLGAIAARRDPPQSAQAEVYYRQALTLAEELGLRPLQAHCHRSLGTLYAATDQWEPARAELSTAMKMYRDMTMTFWLPQTEVAL